MGLFDFLKPKKTATQELVEKMTNQMFPKGDRDMNAGADEVLFILDYSIDKASAKNIFVKSMAISKLAEKFDEERLRAHLAGYCLQHFNNKQIKKFHGYLTAVNVAMIMHNKTPSEVHRKGESYYW